MNGVMVGMCCAIAVVLLIVAGFFGEDNLEATIMCIILAALIFCFSVGIYVYG